MARSFIETIISFNCNWSNSMVCSSSIWSNEEHLTITCNLSCYNRWNYYSTILPLGAVALMGLGVSVLTKTLTFAAAFSAFGDPIPWLIALAFLFARGFIKTGLGNRIAYQFVFIW
ncbi:Dicarboxylate transporter 1 protein [Thalictrum thalictroides]|uniref:Dicarboxylate transporter 1 protein n=1 Tax=Thalictrum thalictroides TaxID=46969 RepID=A0A7J6VZV8_THATH|nr:Dicarboxylate transporter 1 protein [Thalictrum thalictroides]